MPKTTITVIDKSSPATSVEWRDKNGWIHCLPLWQELSQDLQEELREYKEWTDKVWCKCGEYHGYHFVPDGVDDECEKHHWRCNKCNGITCIG